MTADLTAALSGFAALDAEALGRKWTWRDGAIDVRYALYRTLEEAQEAHVSVAAAPHPESRRILTLAQRAFGDLSGLLVGVPAELLDRVPHESEWPLREVLRHLVIIERRYARQTLWALERTDADPLRIPEDRLATAAQVDPGGDVTVLLGRLASARRETNRALDDVAPAAMTRPTPWLTWQLDVRFRLHRFAAHLVEHTVQCEKILAALDFRQAEGRRIVRRVTAALAELEGLGADAAVRDLEARLVERFASVA
jgi:DinB superfamily